VGGEHIRQSPGRGAWPFFRWLAEGPGRRFPHGGRPCTSRSCAGAAPPITRKPVARRRPAPDPRACATVRAFHAVTRPGRHNPAGRSAPALTTTTRGEKGMDTVQPTRFGYRQELRRTLGFADLLFYGLVFMVPIAPMGIFGSVYVASGGMVALAYLVGMVALVFTAASYAQMVKAFPLAGSVYNYAGRGIAAPVGFLAGWAVLLDYMLVPSLLSLIAAVCCTRCAPASDASTPTSKPSSTPPRSSSATPSYRRTDDHHRDLPDRPTAARRRDRAGIPPRQRRAPASGRGTADGRGPFTARRPVARARGGPALFLPVRATPHPQTGHRVGQQSGRGSVPAPGARRTTAPGFHHHHHHHHRVRPERRRQSPATWCPPRWSRSPFTARFCSAWPLRGLAGRVPRAESRRTDLPPEPDQLALIMVRTSWNHPSR
jgi:hypothetical protein